MSATQTHNPAVTRAAERYLEQYGEPMVMNSYLKAVVLALTISNAIGKVEIERMKETHFDGSRGGRNYSLDRQVEPLVMDSEISGLEDKHAFLKLENSVARFQFEYLHVPSTSPDLVPRKVHDDELTFDPKTLQSKMKAEVVAATVDEEPLPREEDISESIAVESSANRIPAAMSQKPEASDAVPAAPVSVDRAESGEKQADSEVEKPTTHPQQMSLLGVLEPTTEGEAMLFSDDDPDTPPSDGDEHDSEFAKPSFSVGAL